MPCPVLKLLCLLSTFCSHHQKATSFSRHFNALVTYDLTIILTLGENFQVPNNAVFTYKSILNLDVLKRLLARSILVCREACFWSVWPPESQRPCKFRQSTWEHRVRLSSRYLDDRCSWRLFEWMSVNDEPCWSFLSFPWQVGPTCIDWQEFYHPWLYNNQGDLS